MLRARRELDDALLAEAMAVSGLPTKKATVEEALRRMVRRHRQANAIAGLAGAGWVGDLDEMRRDRQRNQLQDDQKGDRGR